MSCTLLITNGAHDMVTDYLATWSDKLCDIARGYADVTVCTMLIHYCVGTATAKDVSP